MLFPAATARAALRLDGAGDAGRRAEALYLDVVGRMRWFDPRPACSTGSRRDFDVLDDDSVAAATVRDGELRIGREAYRAIVLPGCAVLEARTAERLTEFVDAGGTLIAVGPLPAHAAGIGGDDAAVAELAARFAAGAAQQVDEPDGDRRGAAGRASPGAGAGTDAAADRRRRGAPVRPRRLPALDRRRGRPRIGRAAPVGARSQLPLRSGRQRALDGRRARRRGGRGAGVGAVLGRPPPRRRASRSTAVCGCGSTSPTARARCSPGVWAATCAGAGAVATAREAAARRRVGGRGRGDARGRVGGSRGARRARRSETWDLDDGVHATFGPRALLDRARARRTRSRRPATTPAEWQQAAWSLSRGIHKDPIHVEFLGPERPRARGVPRLRPGRRRGGRARPGRRRRRAAGRHRIWRSAPRRRSAPGSTAGPWRSTAPATSRRARSSCPARPVVLDLRLIAIEDVDALRAHFAFVADVDGYRRPEWLRPAARAREELGRRLHDPRSHSPPSRTSADVLVGANGPCRLLVDGHEVGRQGGFDPYAEWDRDRLQPYDLRGAPPSGRARAPSRAARPRPHPPGRAARRPRPHASGARRRCGPTPTGPWRSTATSDAARLPAPPARRSGVQPRLAATAPASGGRLARAGARHRRRRRARHRHRRPRHGHPAAAPDRSARRHGDLRPARARLPRRGYAWAAAGRGAAGTATASCAACSAAAGRSGDLRDRGRAGARPLRRRGAHRAGRLHRRTRVHGAGRLAGGGPRQPQRRRPLPPAPRPRRLGARR